MESSYEVTKFGRQNSPSAFFVRGYRYGGLFEEGTIRPTRAFEHNLSTWRKSCERSRNRSTRGCADEFRNHHRQRAV